MYDLVSVIMSAYNEKLEYVQQAIDSVLNQTWKSLEIIIVMDNPDYDELVKLVKEYQQKNENIQIIINETNIGLPCSLNKAINYAKGKYIARMDADDISFPERIEKQIIFLGNNHFDIVASKKIDIDESGKIMIYGLEWLHMDILSKLLKANWFISI